MAPCQACGGATSWEADVGSAVCIQCGTLADPTQSVLDSGDPDDAHRELRLPHVGPATLKSMRNGGWDLAGQGKEGRDRRNTVSALPTHCRLTVGIPLTRASRSPCTIS